MSWRPDPDATISEAHAAQVRIGNGSAINPDDIRILANALLDIAELAMPDTYFTSDRRCQLARVVLAAHKREVGGR